MNRRDLQLLSQMRLKEAKVLLEAGYFSGFYYLAGYAVECALKSCIAKSSLRYDFPDKKRALASHTHDLDDLLRVAGLDAVLRADLMHDPRLQSSWNTVTTWSEIARYEIHTEAQASDMMQAVSNPKHGVMRWLTRRW